MWSLGKVEDSREARNDARQEDLTRKTGGCGKPSFVVNSTSGAMSASNLDGDSYEIWQRRAAPYKTMLWRSLHRFRTEAQLHSPKIAQFNGNEMMKAALEEFSASTAWCRDRSVGLWQETAMFGDELGGIRDELRTVQRHIKEAATTRNEEIYPRWMRSGVACTKSRIRVREAAGMYLTAERATLDSETVKGNERVRDKVTRNQEICLEMDMLGRRMQENRDSRLEDLRDGQENVGALHKEMRSEIEMVQDELRTIQRRLMAALNQQPWDSELAASFLQIWLRQETQVVKKNSDGDGSTCKKRPFMPLLTKKQRKVLERAEMALQQPRRFPNRKDRHGKQRNIDESKAGTNTTLEGSRFAEKEWIAQEKRRESAHSHDGRPELAVHDVGFGDTTADWGQSGFFKEGDDERAVCPVVKSAKTG
ncbi:hypothetical protein B0H13DRAFT_1855543 [Mycena leptocephala]|nr:hypothetical protein B0H13DRAFT_1855543 [Mycena leptocephala]